MTTLRSILLRKLARHLDAEYEDDAKICREAAKELAELRKRNVALEADCKSAFADKCVAINAKESPHQFFHDAWAYAKEHSREHTNGCDKRAFDHVNFWMWQLQGARDKKSGTPGVVVR